MRVGEKVDAARVEKQVHRRSFEHRLVEGRKCVSAVERGGVVPRLPQRRCRSRLGRRWQRRALLNPRPLEENPGGAARARGGGANSSGHAPSTWSPARGRTSFSSSSQPTVPSPVKRYANRRLSPIAAIRRSTSPAAE